MDGWRKARIEGVRILEAMVEEVRKDGGLGILVAISVAWE